MPGTLHHALLHETLPQVPGGEEVHDRPEMGLESLPLRGVVASLFEEVEESMQGAWKVEALW